jgi:hypothetical protein
MYILDAAGNPELCDDTQKWGRWFRDVANRTVAKDDVSDDVRVSTVFLGIDHSFDEGVPVLWETMIFGGPHNDYQERYTSLDDAKGRAREGAGTSEGGGAMSRLRFILACAVVGVIVVALALLDPLDDRGQLS